MDIDFVEQYLKRIGLAYDEHIVCDDLFLKKLQYAHVTSVPYETIDITQGKALSLERDDLFKKIVTEHKGGFCFELNGLFTCLLRELGYNVTEHFARFLRGESDIPIRRHRVAVVKIGEDSWLCDVGVGSTAPRIPLLIREGLIQEQYGEAYRFKKADFFGWIIEERADDGKWSNYYSFTEEPELNKDFIPTMFFCEKHPDSPFRNLMLSIKTDKGRITVDGRLFKITENKEIVFRKELSEEELITVKAKYFGL